jgi:two-component system chemotaxis response regulator CheB
MSTPLNVLIVDDSAVIRQILGGILTQDGMQVTVAQDPILALRKMSECRPDVIVLDLEMPRMDGLTFLRKIMAESPVPVVVCSSLAERGSAVALQALEEGAVEVIPKPQGSLRTFLNESSAVFIEAVRGAAQARVGLRPASSSPSPSQPTAERRLTGSPAFGSPTLTLTTDRVVAIGASTGGTEIIRRLLTSLPPDAPGMVIVQHIPGYFATAFAKRMAEVSKIEVKEAEPGDRIIEGRALLAPGNRHLVVRRSGAHYVVELLDGEPVNRHRPSVDVLFHSVAEAAGQNAVGALLTGMGNDGADGLLAMRSAGAHTMAQDEASSVVWGMPKEAIDRGAACEIVSIDTLAASVLRAARTRRHASPMPAVRAVG